MSYIEIVDLISWKNFPYKKYFFFSIFSLKTLIVKIISLPDERNKTVIK